MKVFFEVWCRIEGLVEAETAHVAYHLFDKMIKDRLYNQYYRPFYVNGQVSKIRCFEPLTTNNLDCGEINVTPCPWCKNKDQSDD